MQNNHHANTTPLPFATPHIGGKRRCAVKASREETLRYLGYAGQAVDAHLEARVEALIQEAETTLPALYTWRVFAINEEDTRWLDSATPLIALTSTPLTLRGTSITRHLTGARAVAVLSCTMGMACERALRTKSALNATDALIFGAAASSLVEAGADAACKEIADFAATFGWHTGERYSPGYGDLPLSTQREIATALELPKTLGVSLTESNLLIPVKSMTAFVGLFPEAPSVSFESPCVGCVNEHHCPFRQKGLTCYDSH
jgi:hypothetical protein